MQSAQELKGEVNEISIISQSENVRANTLRNLPNPRASKSIIYLKGQLKGLSPREPDETAEQHLR